MTANLGGTGAIPKSGQICIRDYFLISLPKMVEKNHPGTEAGQ